MQSPEYIEESARILKEWYMMQPHLPKGVDDRLFVSFICGCKTVENAKRKLDNYMTQKHELRKMTPELVQDPTHPNILKHSKSQKVFFLPGLAEDGSKVFWQSFAGCDASVFDIHYTCLYRYFLIEYAIHLWPKQNKYTMVFDLKDMPLTAQAFPAALVELAYYLNGFPKNVTKIIIGNTHPLTEKLTFLMQAITPKKMHKRLTLTHKYSDFMKELKTTISEKVLPAEYDGQGETTDQLNDYWMEKLKEEKDWIRKRFNEVSDESKRPRESSDSPYGIQGTFRKLNID